MNIMNPVFKLLNSGFIILSEYMRIPFLLTIILLFFTCQNLGRPSFVDDYFWNEISWDKKNMYLVFRGTNTKEGNISRSFNISDTLSSHVGIAINMSNSWKVFHVMYTNNSNSHLHEDKLSTFFNRDNNDLFYASVWKINNLTSLEKENISQIINQYRKQTIKFDRNFSSKDTLKLYCSEFVVSILEKTNRKIFMFSMQKTQLKKLYSNILRKDSLNYYPVDVFQYNPNFEQIAEWHF